MDQIKLNLQIRDDNDIESFVSMDKQTWIQAVYSKLIATEIAPHYGKTGTEIVQSLTEPKVYVGAQMLDKKPQLGQSKIGGNPHVCDNFEWPCEDDDPEMPLQFLAQINLSELRKADFDQLLPENGMLWFFCIADADRAYGYELNNNTKKVIFETNIHNLKSHTIPEDLLADEDATIEERSLIFGPCITFEEVLDSGIESYIHDCMIALGGKIGATSLCFDFLEVIDEDIEYLETPEDPIPVYMVANFDGYFIAPNAFGEGFLNFTIDYKELEKENITAIEFWYDMGT